MTAQARQLRAGHWADKRDDQLKHMEPDDQRPKTGIDKATALTVWAVGPIVSIAIVAALAWVAVQIRG